MATASDDKRIRHGLQFIATTDKAIIRAADRLERMFGDAHPPGIFDLLKRYTFNVAGKKYHGLMTVEQYTYLKDYEDSLKSLANAIATVIINQNNFAATALSNLGDAMAASSSDRATDKVPAIVFPQPAVGCCTYSDGPPKNVSESFCETGLQGTWSENPCRQTQP